MEAFQPERLVQKVMAKEEPTSEDMVATVLMTYDQKPTKYQCSLVAGDEEAVFYYQVTLE